MSTDEIGMIQFKGLPEGMIDGMRSLASKHAERLQRLVKNEFLLEVHVNERQTEGSKSRFEVKTRFSYPGATIASEKEDWDFWVAARLALEALEEQISGKYSSTPVDRPAQETYRVVRVEEVEDGLRFLRG